MIIVCYVFNVKVNAQNAIITRDTHIVKNVKCKF